MWDNPLNIENFKFGLNLAADGIAAGLTGSSLATDIFGSSPTADGITAGLIFDHERLKAI